RRDFRYIRVDGVVPSIENVAAGKYLYWAQSSDYIPNAGRPNTATGVAGQIAAAFSNAATVIGNVGQISALNQHFEYTIPAFDGGFLALPASGGQIPNPATGSVVTSFQGNPVNTYTRANGGGSPNNCQTPYASSVAPNVGVPPVWATPSL